MNEDQPKHSPSPLKRKPQSSTRWALLFPIAILAVVVFLNSRTPETPNGSQPNSYSMTPTASDHGVATNAAEASATTTSGSASPRQSSAPAQIWVPGDDAMLHPKPFKASSGGASWNTQRDSLNAVIEAAPDLFPGKAQVQSVRHDTAKKRIVISVNQAFADDTFWNKSE
ncbi:MAG: hypothetical protein JWN98_2327, partial [Abditibacteriota bacterium]|nr:hypothetical protein [Abditibacteriota bacterium]